MDLVSWNLHAVDIPAGALRTADPSRHWRGGPIRQIRTPVGTPSQAGMPPRLGQHTREVLAEYGLTESEITVIA